MTNIRYKFIYVAIALLVLWNISALFIARSFFTTRVDVVIDQKTELSRERAGDLADSIERNLTSLHGIPDLLSLLTRVKNASLRFGQDATPSTLPLEERKKRWTKDHNLNDLSQYLALAKVSLSADIIFVINAAGDCIAASNWNNQGNTIGENFVDRDYFKYNKNGQHGMQYAVGKTTNIPGIYFSTPIMINGHFMGAVVAKKDVPNLSFLVHELDAFVTDEYGVIVLASDTRLEMRSVLGASIDRMPVKKRIARYKTGSFPVFQMNLWGDKRFPTLMRFQGENVPHVLSSKNITPYHMKAYVVDHIYEYNSLNHDKFWFAFLMGISGSILILMMGSLMLYLTSIKAKEIALERANKAERRIISISEDTQQRIGRELHDDLGQLLTGIAFMSEVLSQKLSNQDHAEANQVSKITAYINDAISKTSILARGLYPVELKEADLPAMLQKLAKYTGEIYNVNCQFISNGELTVDDPLTVINLFRISQEAINNAIKHGKPANITIKLISAPTAITLEISDDGTSINQLEESGAKPGLGLRSMQYRASLLGGAMHILALPDGGTRLTVNLPVKRSF